MAAPLLGGNDLGLGLDTSSVGLTKPDTKTAESGSANANLTANVGVSTTTIDKLDSLASSISQSAQDIGKQFY